MAWTGKAPVINNSGSAEVINQQAATYSPVAVPANTAGLQMLGEIQKNLAQMQEVAQKINDYNDETEMMTQLQQLSNQAKIEKWTPDQYEKEFQKLTSSWSFDNPELQAQVNRYAQLHFVSTSAELQAYQHQKQVANSLANAYKFLETLKNGITDKTSFEAAKIQAKVRLQRLSDVGVLNPVAAEKLYQSFVNDSKRVLLTEVADSNPQQFLQEINSGQYDDVFSNVAEKDEIIKAVKAQIKHQQLENERQQREQNAQLLSHYAVALYNGKLNLSQIMKDGSIPDEVKANLISVSSAVIANSPYARAVMSGVENNIFNNRYSGWADFTDDIISKMKKGQLNRTMFVELQDLYSRYNKAQQSKSPTGDMLMDLAKTPQYKVVFKEYIPGTIKTLKNKYVAMEQQFGVSQQFSDIKNTSIQDLTSRAQLRFFDYLNTCSESGKNCDLRKLADMAVFEVMAKPVKDDFVYTNVKNGIITQWQKDLGVGSGLVSRINDLVFKTFVYNDKINPQHYLDLRKIIVPNVRYPIINFSFTPEAQKELGTGFVRFRIYNDGQNIKIEPLTDGDKKIWSKFIQMVGKQ